MGNKQLVLVALFGVWLGAPTSAAGSDVSVCLDAATKLEAGGDVTGNELTAAEHACAHAEQTPADQSTRRKVDAAVVTVADELRKQAAHHPR
jgi:hypothetical protein